MVVVVVVVMEVMVVVVREEGNCGDGVDTKWKENSEGRHGRFAY